MIADNIFGQNTDSIAYYAREADRIARGPQLYGGNAAIVQLRCFKYYHPDQGSWLTGPDGKSHWLGAKGSRIWAIAQRDRQTTMKAIAAEALCCVSTVSRTLTRLQSFGMLAVDVTRGRNGGVTIRLPEFVPAMRHYIAAAWKRIRSWINVASRLAKDEEGTCSTSTLKDATFIQAWSDSEYRGRLQDETRDHQAEERLARRLGSGPDANDRAEAFAREVIRERRRLAEEDPAGEAEAVHPLWIH